MTVPDNPNINKATTLIFIAAGLRMLHFVFAGYTNSHVQLSDELLTFIGFVVSALLIRRGFDWAKWFYVAVSAYSVIDLAIGLPIIFQLISFVEACTLIIHYLLMLLALFLIFMKPRADDVIETIQINI